MAATTAETGSEVSINTRSMHTIIPHFVQCSTSKYESQGTTFYNSPVNLCLCKSIERTKINGESYIKFMGCNVAWRFKTISERDNEYDRVIGLL
jgi:hypothetical protein